jgi:membrane protein implicated in regulation of membrane protease activity
LRWILWNTHFGGFMKFPNIVVTAITYVIKAAITSVILFVAMLGVLWGLYNLPVVILGIIVLALVALTIMYIWRFLEFVFKRIRHAPPT